MPAAYADGASFRQALEARLRSRADEQGVPLNTLRQKLTMERLLARLFAAPTAPWRLKGGYAMELRLAGRARSTRDLDLAAPPDTSSPDDLLEQLREAALTDLGDFLEFAIAGPGQPLATAGPGGWRFPVSAHLGGRRYAAFHLDVGLDAAPAEPAEVQLCEDHLAFAGLPPARVLLVPRERQFAEKLHAYTRPWGDRTNTRTKDLIDLLLLVDLGLPDLAALHRVLADVFGKQGNHELPSEWPAPPVSWADDFAALAVEVGLGGTGLDQAHERLVEAWRMLRP